MITLEEILTLLNGRDYASLKALLPLAAKRLRLYPAVMAGPLITTVVDILGLVTCFEIARLVFGI